MSILYAAVACGPRVLCEQSVGSVDYGKEVRQQLESSIQEYVTFPLGSCTYNCYNSNGISYVAVSEAAASQQQTLNFLRRVQCLFTSDPSRVLEAQSGSEHCHQVDFGRVLSEEMVQFSSQDRNRLMQLHSQVADVSMLMHQNINDLNERGNKLDELFDKTEQFEADAQMFQSTAKRVKEKSYWENCRMRLVLFGAVFIIVLSSMAINEGVYNASILSGEPESIVSFSCHHKIGCDTATTIIKNAIVIFQIPYPFILTYVFFVYSFWCFGLC
ncbi:putative vesicle-associated membrane protein [Echinococcus granulosus]|uniref:Vesicle-associated membrane protein 7 n=1 Tax=Echinococcus granulosus TaxID=6210 RepID=A0A068WM92_ECHGR|nr:putative vesicle-associated membrane protein [Echinococcus granulosus]CDS19616.1 vesicle associated membrane protein [Echinococcus granulosus]